MKIGDTIYVLAEHAVLFQSYEIVGETSRSWTVVDNEAAPWQKLSPYVDKYAKKLPKNLKGYQVGTKREADLAKWGVANRYEISRRVERFAEPEKMLAIARMIGYDNLFEEKINETA
jgi:hypothetical protein